MGGVSDGAEAGGFSHTNNFDLVRLLAAAQVAFVHTVHHMQIVLPFHDTTMRIIGAFPGVPIFFIVSGFLISASYQRSDGLADFVKNRVLRLFPALWLVFVFGVVLAAATGYFIENPVSFPQFLIWAAAQLSVGQFYNPDFMRGYGEGVLNGSLWTLPVEMQFYALTPLLVPLLTGGRRRWAVALLLFAFFIVANVALSLLRADSVDTLAIKLFTITFVPWVYMFMLGAVLSLHWGRFALLFEGRFGLWLLAYCLVVMIDLWFPIGIQGNHILPIWVPLVAGLVLSATFTNCRLSNRLLRRNDISYGSYIYHMPIINFMVEQGWGRGSGLAWLPVPATFFVAWLSWRWVEKPALRLKHYTLLRR